MSKKINQILKEVLEDIEPSKKEKKDIKASLDNLLKKIKKNIGVLKINTEVFVGGSFAKNTLIKKDIYDVDVFLRFNKKYKDDEISNLTRKILGGLKKVVLIHGSRDYFRIKISPILSIELIPVIKIREPKASRNITDLSYSHVKYIKNKIKSKKIIGDIMLAKAFCYANHCYGAESYINGFSGYGLELLVYHYNGFLRFIKAIAKKSEEKIIIDIGKHYKNKQAILIDLNSSKLQSPIILIDPTHKQRNALAALSEETFEKFKKDCEKFLKKPSIGAFEVQKTDIEKIKNNSKKNRFEFILLEIKTSKQEGDVAGSKLLKFYRHLGSEISGFFEIKNKGFNYNGKKSARFFFVVKSKGEMLIQGPEIKDRGNVVAFEKVHKNCFTKKGRIYSKEKVDFNLKKFVNSWKLKNKKRMTEMNINKLSIKN